MSEKPWTPKGAAYDRILSTAAELFYRQGYRATGINEVIAKAGVAKATFYQHFPTKDALCLTYLRNRNNEELEAIEAAIDTKDAPRDRFLAVIECLEPWMIGNDMRGCCFLNMVAEVPDPESPMRREGKDHYVRLQTRIHQLAKDLLRSDPTRYGHLDARTLADDYMVILAGSIALTELVHEMWPIRQGIQGVGRLIASE